MKARPRFFQGVLAAGALALAAAGLITLLTPFFGIGTVVRLTAPMLSLAYLLYLFRATHARTGRIVTVTGWCILAALAWWFVPSTAFYLVLHIGAIWLVRSLYAYSGLVPAVIDLAIAALAALTFVWAITRTGSVLLATWCFFLVQALWSYVPATLAKPPQRSGRSTDNETFERARRRADAALRELLGPSG